MAARDGQMAFVVAGSPPAAVAISAEHVRRIAPEHSFTGDRVVDLRSLGPEVGAASGTSHDDSSHVLVVGAPSDEIGVLVRGRIRFLVVQKSELLPLPAPIERPSRMSHVIASGGVPRIPVVDLARLETMATAPSGAPDGDSEK
jgi:hypothetical protein